MAETGKQIQEQRRDIQDLKAEVQELKIEVMGDFQWVRGLIDAAVKVIVGLNIVSIVSFVLLAIACTLG